MGVETEAHTGVGGQLFELYTKYVSEPESTKHVYGYTLLVVGYLLAMGGLGLYLVGPSSGTTSFAYLLQKIAITPAAVGLASTLLGIVLMLPVRRRGTILAVLGAILCLVAVGWFTMAYPQNWSQGSPSYSAPIITLYTVGLALVAGVVVMVPVVTGERSYFSETSEGHEYDHPDIMIGETDRGGLFAVYKRGTEWTWRLIDQSAVAASTNAFLSRIEAEDRVEAVRDQVAAAGLLEIKHAAFRLYEAGEDAWQWYLMHEDGSVLAEGGHDYDSRDDAEGSINAMKDFGAEADVFVLDEAGYDCYRANGGWRWRLIDEDRTTLARSGDSYAGRDRAVDGLDGFRDLAAEAIDLVIESYGVELRDGDDGWTWRLRDGAHTNLATSTRSYESKGVAEDAVYDLLDALQGASVLEVGEPTYDVIEDGGAWRWRLVDDGGSSVAVAHEDADDQATASEQAERVRSHVGEADVVEIADLEFETYERGGEWHWRLVSSDREVQARSTEGYDTETDAAASVDRVRDEAPDADLIEFDNAAFQVYEAEGGARDSMDGLVATVSEVDQRSMSDGIFQVYADADDEWWWRFVLPDGSVVADAPEGFGTRHAVEDAVDDLRSYAGQAPVETVGTLAVSLDPSDWHWDLVDADRERVAVGAVQHDSRADAEEAIESLQRRATETTVYEIRSAAFDCYQAGDGWSWRLIDADHDVVARTADTFETLADAEIAANEVRDVATDAELIDYDDVAFELYEDAEGWTWRFIDEDQRVIAAGAGRHESRADAEGELDDVRDHIADASVIEIDSAAFEFHQSDEGWRWRLVDDSGTELAESISAFPTRAEAQEELSLVKEHGPDAWTSVAE